MSTDDIFGEVIFRYTRSMAVSDGAYIDVSDENRKTKTYITPGVSELAAKYSDVVGCSYEEELASLKSFLALLDGGATYDDVEELPWINTNNHINIYGVKMLHLITEDEEGRYTITYLPEED